jgi:hypothetical protein
MYYPREKSDQSIDVYMLNWIVKLYINPFISPFDIICQQEVNWIYY